MIHENSGVTNTPPNIANLCSEMRTAIKSMDMQAKYITKLAKEFEEIDGVEKGEMIANSILAYRHLEDAAMRYGKTIQAFEGGKSIYDQNDAERVSKGAVDAGERAE